MANALQLSGFSGSQIALIRNTVAKDCNDQEFNLFFEAAKAYGLDPFRKQISALVFNKDKADKRQMAIIVSRDGYRVIAQRCKNYRPASEPAAIEYDKELISPANPKGIVKATVKLWQQDNTGQWFPVIGEAYWDEFAPMKDAADEYDWVDTGETWPDTGKPKKKKVPRGDSFKAVDGNWARMPVVMITKCAESQALRAGWPDQFGGVYAEEELHRAEADLTAADIVAQEAENSRIARIGGHGVLFSFDPSGVLENVPVGQAADRCVEFVGRSTQEEVYRWSIQNRAALAQFWAAAPGDALEVKKLLEKKLEGFRQGAAA